VGAHPLIIRVKKKTEAPCGAWPGGRHGQEENTQKKGVSAPESKKTKPEDLERMREGRGKGPTILRRKSGFQVFWGDPEEGRGMLGSRDRRGDLCFFFWWWCCFWAEKETQFFIFCKVTRVKNL